MDWQGEDAHTLRVCRLLCIGIMPGSIAAQNGGEKRAPAGGGAEGENKKPKRERKPVPDDFFDCRGKGEVPLEPRTMVVERPMVLTEWSQVAEQRIAQVNPFHPENQLEPHERLSKGEALFKGAVGEAKKMEEYYLEAKAKAISSRDEARVYGLVAQSAVEVLSVFVGVQVARSMLYQNARGHMAPKGQPLTRVETECLAGLVPGGDEEGTEWLAEEAEYQIRTGMRIKKGTPRQYDSEGDPLRAEPKKAAREIVLQQLAMRAPEMSGEEAAYYNYQQKLVCTGIATFLGDGRTQNPVDMAIDDTGRVLLAGLLLTQSGEGSPTDFNGTDEQALAEWSEEAWEKLGRGQRPGPRPGRRP